MVDFFAPMANLGSLLADNGNDLKTQSEATDVLYKLVSQTQLLAALHWLNKMEVLACIPPFEMVRLQHVAEMASVSVTDLSRVIRFTATSGFLCELNTDYVAHTDLSRSFLLRPALVDAIAFIGDARLTTNLNTPLTTQLRGLHIQDPSSMMGHSPVENDSQQQPKAKRQATAFQRLVLQRALSSDSGTVDLLSQWMAEVTGHNATVVQVGCVSDTVGRTLANQHPHLHIIVQLTYDANAAAEMMAREPDTLVFGHVTVQHIAPKSPQLIRDAQLYIVHLPTLSILSSSADMLSQTTHLLWAHFDILRRNRQARLVIVANGLVGTVAVESKAEAAARMYDLLLMQMTTGNETISKDLMGRLLSSVRDAVSRLVILKKVASDSHPTVAFEVGIAPVGRPVS